MTTRTRILLLIALSGLAGCAGPASSPAAGPRAELHADRPAQDAEPPTAKNLRAVLRWPPGTVVPDVLRAEGDDWQASRSFGDYRRLVRYEEPLTAGAARDLILELQNQLSGSATFLDGNGPVIRTRLLAELREVEVALAQPPAEQTLRQAIESTEDPRLRPNRFEPAASAEPAAGIDTDTAFLTGEHAVWLFTSRSERGRRNGYSFCSVEQAIEFRTVCKLVAQLLRGDSGLARIASAGGSVDRAWDHVYTHGYSQYPWELLANRALLDPGGAAAPGWQLVLLHPELTVLGNLHGRREASVDLALAVHGLGFIDYVGPENDWFWGLSATALISTDADQGLGLGGTLHLGSTLAERFPHLSVGAVWQNYGDGESEVALTLGVDVLRLFSRPDIDRVRRRW